MGLFKGNEVEKIDSGRFEEEILCSTTTVIDFYTGWCAPCKKLTPILEDAVSNYDVRAFKLDAEENQDLCLKYNVMSVPTLLFFRSGKEVDRMNGLVSLKDILEIV